MKVTTSYVYWTEYRYHEKLQTKNCQYSYKFYENCILIFRLGIYNAFENSVIKMAI